MGIAVILKIIGLVCFLLAAGSYPPRFAYHSNLVALGLALWAIAFLIPR